MEQEELELETLKKLTPYALPDNTGESGWATTQNKKKFYEGFFYIYNLFKQLRIDLTTADEKLNALLVNVQNEFEGILNGNTQVPKAIGDEDGNNFKVTYAKISALNNGLVGVLKYIKQDGTYANVYDIALDLASHIAAYNLFLANNFVDGKAKAAVTADKAVNDANGNVIHSTYAKNVDLNLANQEINKIKNGSTTVQKASKDQDGNVISKTYAKFEYAEGTYVKKTDIVNDTNTESTDKPLSAAQGKSINDRLVALWNYIYQGASNTSIDRLQEIFAFLVGHDDDETLDALLAQKISFTDVIDNLISNVSNKPLSANQGKLLKDAIDALSAVVNTKANSNDVYGKGETYSKEEVQSLLEPKQDASQVQEIVREQIKGVNTMSVITDSDNNKSYDFQLRVKDGELHLILNEI